jgi:hypothetical protein
MWRPVRLRQAHHPPRKGRPLTTPAEELRRAADELDSMITFLGDNRGPWKVGTPPSGYPQSISNVGVPYCVADTHEDPSIPVFTIAPYIATMHPGIARHLVQLMRDSADSVEACSGGIEICPDATAHAIALLINGRPR